MLFGMEQPPHIMVVDDDREIRDLLARFLEKHRIRVTAVRDARDARRAWANGHYQLVVLDLMLPGEPGLTLPAGCAASPTCRSSCSPPWARRPTASSAWNSVPTIMCPSRSTRGNCLPASAPCCAAPATASGRATTAGARPLRFAGWTLEPSRRRLLNPDGVEVALTGGEYDLLLALAERANRVLTRDMLLDLLRGRQAGPFDRAIDVAISRLRRKLEDDGRNAQLIKTVRGGGYVLAATVEHA